MCLTKQSLSQDDVFSVWNFTYNVRKTYNNNNNNNI